jgi:trehalose synthase-fused probable maltokinase
MNRPDLAAWMEEVLPNALLAFLPQRRWFGGKARPIVGVELEDAAWLPHVQRPCALVVVRLSDAAGEQSRYALVLTFDSDAGTQPVVGRIEGEHETAWAIEAAAQEGAALALLDGFVSSEGRDLPMLRGGILRYRDVDRVAVRVLDSAPRVEQVGVEQSNSSLCIDRMLAFKLFRRLEHGENPELEIGRFLATRTSFRAMPLLRGSLTYISARGEPATLGVLQDWIESRGDGWNHVVALLRQRSDDSAARTLKADAFALGVMTESFHRALASDSSDGAFAPEAATNVDVDAWQRSVVERARRTASLVARHMGSWPSFTRRLGETFVEGSGDLSVVGRLPDPEQPSSGFRKIRVHGDYHLGQILTAECGFVVIDFEGEPARPLAERRAKQPALRDIAGMLRSFDYAIEAAQVGSQARDDDEPVARVLRQRFLDGYRAAFADRAPEFVPADPEAAKAWVDFFELEKALYEVEYEINNRPTWVHIPLRGLVRIVGGQTGGRKQ